MVQKGIQYCELDALFGCAGFFSNRIFMKKNHSFLPVILLLHLKYGTHGKTDGKLLIIDHFHHLRGRLCVVWRIPEEVL